MKVFSFILIVCDMLRHLFCFLILASPLLAMQDLASLMCDLEAVRYWDQFVDIPFPHTFNHQLQTGYFTTPSAHMGTAGELGFGVGSVSPYTVIAGRIQLFDHLELTGNYHIFREVDDPVLSQYGFGNFARRSASVKVGLITPQETLYQMPGIAVGVDDFMGDKSFFNIYGVATQIFYEEGLELSVGWGTGRYTGGPSRGFFGAVSWFPFFQHCHFLRNLSIVGELDPIDYKNPHREPHPCGRKSNFPINAGVKYNIASLFYLSASYIRGREWAFFGAINYNIGACKGLLPRTCDPPPFQGLNTSPLGPCRPEEQLAIEFQEAFCEQGFYLTKAAIEYCTEGKKRLWLWVVNRLYRQECRAKREIDRIVAHLAPANFTEVIVITEAMGFPVQSYRYSLPFLSAYLEDNIGDYAFCLLTYRQDPCRPAQAIPLLCCPNDLYRIRVTPRYETFFGSAKGKFKYDIGVRAAIEGFLAGRVFYELELSYTLYSTIRHIADLDRFNPSQLPNVNSDYVNYRQFGRFSTEKAYLQKGWYLGRSFYSRASAGYFQVNYAGVAGEVLWYPACSWIALGWEGALLRKRDYTGLGFQSRLRELDGFTPTYHSYTLLSQCFFDFYFDIQEWCVSSKISLGKFLADDVGGRFEVCRYFDNGLRLSFWVALTNAHDVMHGKVYFDRGVAIEVPLDLFLKHSCRRIWNYGLAAWLRDAGARTGTGRSLYETIYRERC